MTAPTPVRFRARLSRVGMQVYEHGPEHRDASEVFHPESLAGLDGLRVQRGHVPSNGTAVGRVVPGSVRRDGDHVAAELEITDATTIADIRQKRIRGISLAYSCEHVTDAEGRTWQTQIRFSEPSHHVALLDSQRERARCGETCSIHDHFAASPESKLFMAERTDSGGSILHTDCACDQAQRDRIEAWLDGTSHLTGIPKAYLVTQLGMRADAETAHITLDTIEQAARELSRQGGGAAPAQYHNPGRAPRADAAADDNAFRAALAAKLRVDGGATDATTTASATPDAARADAIDNSDEAFREHLALRARGGGATQ